MYYYIPQRMAKILKKAIPSVSKGNWILHTMLLEMCNSKDLEIILVGSDKTKHALII